MSKPTAATLLLLPLLASCITSPQDYAAEYHRCPRHGVDFAQEQQKIHYGLVHTTDFATAEYYKAEGRLFPYAHPPELCLGGCAVGEEFRTVEYCTTCREKRAAWMASQ